MSKSIKLLREKNAKLQRKNDPIYFGVFVFVSVFLTSLVLPKIENFWLDALVKGGVVGIISVIAILLLFGYRFKKNARNPARPDLYQKEKK